MTDINEYETLEYITNGLKKARAAAILLYGAGKKPVWGKVVTSIDQLLVTAQKLATGKAQTQLQTLALAATIEAEASMAVH